MFYTDEAREAVWQRLQSCASVSVLPASCCILFVWAPGCGCTLLFAHSTKGQVLRLWEVLGLTHRE